MEKLTVKLKIPKYDLIYTVSQKKLCQCYFLNNSVKHWLILVIFGLQHQKKRDVND